MPVNFKDTKGLFEYVRNYNPGNILTLKEILKNYSFDSISIEDLIKLLYKDKNTFLIDCRTEKEFEETHIPFSINFPILTNEERHNTGLIYNKYSQKAAFQLAVEYAEPKINKLKLLLEKNFAKDKNIIIYCWRGGGRSKYTAKILIDLGHNVKVLIGGIKSYRNIVYNEFYLNNYFNNLIEISGLTGTGKTEIIESLLNIIPTINLEKAARHYSSLFGTIPYTIRKIKKVKNQSCFENNLYSQILFNRYFFPDKNIWVIESESRKVGDFYIPQKIYDKMKICPTIKIESNIDNRVNRIKKDYFGESNEGYDLMFQTFSDKIRYFKKEMSSKIYNDLLFLLKKEKINDFIEGMLINFYDKRYKEKDKKPIAIINSDDIIFSKHEILKIYNSERILEFRS